MKTKGMLLVSFVAVFSLMGIGFSSEMEVEEGLSGASKALAGSENPEDATYEQGFEGGFNTFYGSQAGYTIEFDGGLGKWNTFIGRSAGYYTNRPDNQGNNTFVGDVAGLSNTTGINNTFIGSEAGHQNITSSDNTFMGYQAGRSNTADNNTFIGYAAGKSNTSGWGNVFLGSGAGTSNVETTKNTFLGYGAGYWSTGSDNTFIGASSGSGYPPESIGSYNTFVGTTAGDNNQDGWDNTFIGWAAGSFNTDGDYNTFIGHCAGRLNEGGSQNTYIGYDAGYGNKAGTGNVFLGYKAGKEETGSNKLYIDNSDTVTPLIWGDFETNNVVIYGGFRAIASYSSSDGRWKRNIEPLESSLEKVSRLQGVSYEWKTDEYPDFGLPQGKQIGLVAQDVEQVLPELVAEDKDGYKAVSYSKLTAVLVEAVKELRTENQKQLAENEGQQKLIYEQMKQLQRQQTEIDELRALIHRLKG